MAICSAVTLPRMPSWARPRLQPLALAEDAFQRVPSMSNMTASVTMPSPRPCLFSRHHEFADRLWQTLPLPLMFRITRHACIVCGGRQLHGFDSVDCRSQCVVRHVRGGDGVGGSTSDRAHGGPRTGSGSLRCQSREAG